MSKISLEDLAEALSVAKVEPAKQTLVLNHLQEVINELAAEKAATSAPKQKNEFGVILYSEDDSLNGKEFTASVYSIPQGSDHNQVLYKISSAARESNEAAKKKTHLIETIGQAFQSLKRKWIKDKNVMLKSKIPVRVLISSNKLV